MGLLSILAVPQDRVMLMVRVVLELPHARLLHILVKAVCPTARALASARENFQLPKTTMTAGVLELLEEQRGQSVNLVLVTRSIWD